MELLTDKKNCNRVKKLMGFKNHFLDEKGAFKKDI